MQNTLLKNRSLIRIAANDPAEDIREFLQGLVTQDLQLVQPDAPQWAALLNAQGKVMFDFFLWSDGEDILIDCEGAVVESLAKRLKLYRLRRKIDIVIEEALSVHWSREEGGHTADPRLIGLGQRWLAKESEGEGVDEACDAHRLSLGVTEGQAELGAEKTLWLECNADELKRCQLYQGLLCRSGKYCANELPAEDQPAYRCRTN